MFFHSYLKTWYCIIYYTLTFLFVTQLSTFTYFLYSVTECVGFNSAYQNNDIANKLSHAQLRWCCS